MAAKTRRFFAYQVSQRVTLQPGDKFRARGGPYYLTAAGVRESMDERGPFTFLAHVRRGGRQWIEAWGRDGFCVLWIGRKTPCEIVPGMVLRPYRILGKVGISRRQQAKRKPKMTA